MSVPFLPLQCLPVSKSTSESPSEDDPGGPSFIGTLDDDILWSIFKINANMKGDMPGRPKVPLSQWRPRALTATLACSQVCQSWRAMVLRSSSIWAGLIDIDYLFRLKLDGREEILGRIGGALISVKGTIHTAEQREFVLRLLREEWHRLQNFSIRISDLESINDLFLQDDWAVLYTPSKSLQSFSFFPENSNSIRSFIGPSTLNIFGDEAPRLDSFSFRPTSALKFTGRWFSNLRDLYIEGTYTGTESILGWLEALNRMNHLERLRVAYAISVPADITSPLPIAQLPFLHTLVVHGRSILEVALFLDHIFPGQGCGLRLCTQDTRTPSLTDPLFPRINASLSRFSENWFGHARCLGTIYLSSSRNHLSISHSEMPSIARDPLFEIIIHHGSHRRDVDFFLSFLHAFSLCDFSGITRMVIRGLEKDQMSTSHVQKFLKAFSNVEILKTGRPTLGPLIFSDRKQGDKHVVFPKLRKLVAHGALFLTQPPLEDSWTEFLQWRRKIEHPVPILDLTKCREAFPREVLEAVRGLKVLWRDSDGEVQEYVCRSGKKRTFQEWVQERSSTILNR
ncbi:unnamed protein product [Cyclocybe aegerita]|uniref:F-box domain-containing protein n=1 Tax=Cyclocybe aegerita TaxID=1973307 RepID=A0A8S0XGV2_CYCAE|nr:unnamed protein product [Cyclocybe aegerita]